MMSLSQLRISSRCQRPLSDARQVYPLNQECPTLLRTELLTTFTREDGHTRVNGNSPDPTVTTVTVRRAKPANDELSVLREQWMNKIIDLVSGIPLQLPPLSLSLRMINHEIK